LNIEEFGEPDQIQKFSVVPKENVPKKPTVSIPEIMSEEDDHNVLYFIKIRDQISFYKNLRRF
jgi:hypothetical protein